MTDQPTSHQSNSGTGTTAAAAAAAKATTKPVPKLPAIIPTPKPVHDDVARILGTVALVSSLGIGGALYFRATPTALPDHATTASLYTVKQRNEVLTQEISTLKQNLQTLTNTIATTAATTPTVTPTISASAPTPAATSSQLQQAETEIDTLRTELAGLKSGLDAAKNVQQEVAQLKSDLLVANAAIAAVHGHVQQMTDTAHAATTAEASTRAQVIAYLQLRNAAATATPFTDELQKLAATAKNVTDLPALVAKLENPAHGGVATLPMLQGRFSVMAGPAEQAMELAAAKNWWDRVLAHMQEVISIRRIERDGSNGDGKALHDAAAALQRGNIAGAITAVETLPPEAQKEMQEWLIDAKARVALDAALAQIGALLGQTAPDDAAPTATPAPETPVPAPPPAADKNLGKGAEKL